MQLYEVINQAGLTGPVVERLAEVPHDGALIAYPGDVPHIYDALERGTTAAMVIEYV